MSLYDNEAMWTLYKPDINRDRFWEIFSKYIQQFISEDSTVLDIGAGYCHFINNIKAKKKTVVDLRDIKMFANKNVRVIKEDCIKFLEQDNEMYDVVFMSNLLEHLERKEMLWLISLLKEKCKKIIILGPNYIHSYKQYFNDPTHLTILTHVTMKRILETEGFKIEKIYPKIIPFSVETPSANPFPPIPKFLIWLYLHSPVKFFAGQFLVVAHV